MMSFVNSFRIVGCLHLRRLLIMGRAYSGVALRRCTSVTELTDCERTSDKWLCSVQQEFRHGTLTKDMHAFLHGESIPTWLMRKLPNAGAQICTMIYDMYN